MSKLVNTYFLSKSSRVNLCSSNHPILFKFHQLISPAHLFRNYKYYFIHNSNGNMEDLERKIQCVKFTLLENKVHLRTFLVVFCPVGSTLWPRRFLKEP